MPTLMPLTTGRVVALVIGVPFALLLIAWGAVNFVALAASSSVPVERTLPGSGGAVSATVVAGDLSFVPDGTGQVQVKGVVDYHLVPPTITITNSGSGVSIDVSCATLIFDACDAELTVAVPPNAAITATMISGNISATGIDDVSLQSTSGNLTVSDIAGVARLEDTSGAISGSDLGAATVSASTVSGQVSLAFSVVPSSVSVEDTSGSVLVTIPNSSTAYLVTAHSTSGSSSIGVPTAPASTHVISITTVSGDISVEPAG